MDFITDLLLSIKSGAKILLVIIDWLSKGVCHGASCMQANDAEGRKNDRLGKERRKEKEGFN